MPTTLPVQNPNQGPVDLSTSALNRKVTHHRTNLPITLAHSHIQDGWTDGDSVDATVHPLGIKEKAAAES